jgi:Skp family chaperone for outer membrane proteins
VTAWAQQGEVAYVSRERILQEVESARRFRAAETELTAKLQARIDEAKASLAAEESDLAQRRSELSPDEFEALAVDFDRRLRLVRLVAQERVTELQRGFQQGRANMVAALPAILEDVRREAGVKVLLNSDAILAVDPALDLTSRAIELFDEKGPRPHVPKVDLTSPLLPPAEGPATGEEQDRQ